MHEMCVLLCIASNCPNGYSTKKGSLVGNGFKALYVTSMEMCRDECDATDKCVGFDFSKKKGECKLTDVAKSLGTEYSDFQFCLKKISIFG